jgi:hypothetical protein
VKQQSDKWTLAIAHSHHHQNLDWAANTLRDTILAAIQLAVPTTKPSPRSKVWWTQELTEKRKDMATMERRWKEAQTPLAKLRYKLSRNIYGRALQEAKAKCWDNFLAEAQGKEVYTAFRYTKPRRVQRTPVLKAGNQTATVFTEKARLFRHTLFPPPPEYATTTAAGTNVHLQQSQWTPVTDQEIRDAIFSSAPRKAPGPDGINFECIRQAYNAIPNWFNSLFREVLNQGYHPICWREATGAIIPKPNKPDYTAIKAYRIVALLNCLGKIAEKLVARRLADLCENLLHKDQMGGRRQRSAQDAILALVHDVEQGWQQKLTTSALFLDVKGAFDNVSRVRLLETMKQMGLP